MSQDADAERVAESGDEPATRTRIERLEAENARLRSRSGSMVTHRRAAVLFAVAAAAFFAATDFFPSARGVLIALAGIGVFGAILFVTLTTDPVVPTTVAAAVSDTRSQNLIDLSRLLGVDGRVTYVPTASSDVRMYVSSDAYEDIPFLRGDDPTIVKEGDRNGLVLEPAGRHLLAVLEERTGGLPDDVESALPVLLDAVTDTFGLAAAVDTVTEDGPDDSEDRRITIRVSGTEFGHATDIDHPVRSLVGVGLATVLGTPVETDASTADEHEVLIAFRWRDEPPPELEQLA